MAPSRSLLQLALALLAASLASAASLTVEDPVPFGWPAAVPCRGTVEQCLAAAAAGHGEFEAGELASGPNRRFLYASGYIGYGALQADRVPCSRRGASYYNCRPGGEANPYGRGCNAITQCRG